MSKTYPIFKRNPQITEKNAEKFSSEFINEAWPPVGESQDYAQVILKSLLVKEAAAAFGRDMCIELLNEIKQAANISFSVAGSSAHYIKASDHLFRMIEQGKVAEEAEPVIIIGLDGNFLFDQS